MASRIGLPDYLPVFPCWVFRSSRSLTLRQWCCDGTRDPFFEVRFARACTTCAAPDPSLRPMCRATLDPKRREKTSSVVMSVFGDVCWLDGDSRVTQTFRVQPMLLIHSQFAQSSLHGWPLSCCLFLNLCPRRDFAAHICLLSGRAHLLALADAFERDR